MKKTTFIIIFVILLYGMGLYGVEMLNKKGVSVSKNDISVKEEKKDSVSDTLSVKKETNPVTRDVLIAGGLSLIFPGGGQFYNKKYLKGIFVGGLEISGIYLTYNLFKNDSVYKEDFAWYLAFFVIYSVFDAIVDAQFKHIEVKLNE